MEETQQKPGSKEIDIVIIVSSGGSRGGSTTKRESGAGFWELLHSSAKRLDVVVPEAERVLQVFFDISEHDEK